LVISHNLPKFIIVKEVIKNISFGLLTNVIWEGGKWLYEHRVLIVDYVVVVANNEYVIITLTTFFLIGFVNIFVRPWLQFWFKYYKMVLKLKKLERLERNLYYHFADVFKEVVDSELKFHTLPYEFFKLNYHN